MLRGPAGREERSCSPTDPIQTIIVHQHGVGPFEHVGLKIMAHAPKIALRKARELFVQHRNDIEVRGTDGIHSKRYNR